MKQSSKNITKYKKDNFTNSKNALYFHNAPDSL